MAHFLTTDEEASRVPSSSPIDSRGKELRDLGRRGEAVNGDQITSQFANGAHSLLKARTKKYQCWSEEPG